MEGKVWSNNVLEHEVYCLMHRNSDIHRIYNLLKLMAPLVSTVHGDGPFLPVLSVVGTLPAPEGNSVS